MLFAVGRCKHSKEEKFITSLSIISEVMNIPLSAVKCYLRCNGYDDDIEPSSNCIDEKMLELFDDAYLRKMRNYLSRSIKHLDTLSPSEHDDLVQFIQTFKKENCQKRTLSKFTPDDIDEEKLLLAFRDRIKEKTPTQSSGYLCDSILSAITVCAAKEEILEPIALFSLSAKRDTVYLSSFALQETNRLLDSIAHSKYYITDVKIEKIPTYRISKTLRIIYRSARFHIYIDDDDSIIKNSEWYRLYYQLYIFNYGTKKKYYQQQSA